MQHDLPWHHQGGSMSRHLFGYGYNDFFVFAMSAGGGWDEAAWAAKGLPPSGALEITLHMHSVGA
jgi:hypothetical protein